MPSIEAVYENGVFRPLQPVELPEGAHVEVFATDSAQMNNGNITLAATPPLVGEALHNLLQEIDKVPLESEPDPDLSTTYRDILYPKHGDNP